MRIVCIGDNVVDCYLDEGVCYPGGDAVNVAVHAKRCGAVHAEYLGVFGSDDAARHIQQALDAEGIPYGHSRRIDAISGHPGVRISESGDRVFVGGPRHTAQTIVRMQLTLAELDLLASYDICHTTCFSMLEHELPSIAQKIPISFDFSVNHQIHYIDLVAPHVRHAFFSGAGLDEMAVNAIFDRCRGHGCEHVVITFGERGAALMAGGNIIRQNAASSDVVDTMGAGDSFIASFLTAFYTGHGEVEALSMASAYAARMCEQPGAFGYPYPLEKDYLHVIDPVRNLIDKTCQ